jgi:hypothetical protein
VKNMGTTTTSLLRIAPLVIVGLCLLLAGCEDDKLAEHRARREAMWEGATVVRICVDGTRIYRMHDGRFIARKGWAESPVEGPEVCK